VDCGGSCAVAGVAHGLVLGVVTIAGPLYRRCPEKHDHCRPELNATGSYISERPDTFQGKPARLVEVHIAPGEVANEGGPSRKT
jgi:hypothetical protein